MAKLGPNHSIPTGIEMATLLEKVVTRWHEDEPPLNWTTTTRRFPTGNTSLGEQIKHLGLINCYQWHLESECRVNYDTPEILARLKHSIDRSNKRRVDMIDEIDFAIYRDVHRFRSELINAPLTLVSPGNLVDRLSILLLKKYHAAEKKARSEKANQEILTILQEQILDLCVGIDRLIHELITGKQRIKFYRTVKLYGEEYS